MKTIYDACIYPSLSVFVLGILGNILVIVAILKQSSLLKNNYYFFVLQLAFSDLGCLVVNTCGRFYIRFAETPFSPHNYFTYCFVIPIMFFFQISGIYLMLAISVHRYRATVRPLKPAISREKIKAACALGYLFAMISGYGIFTMVFFKRLKIGAYLRALSLHGTFIFIFAPTVFMAVVYCKIGRALRKQNKSMKTARSNLAQQGQESFKILKYVQNRRAFIVCFTTVLCYGIGNLPTALWSIWFIAGKSHLTTRYGSVFGVGEILRVAGSCAVNPLIYGIWDRKLRVFWKFCRKKKRRADKNESVRVLSARFFKKNETLYLEAVYS